MKNLLKKLAEITQDYQRIERQLVDPRVIEDFRKLAELSQKTAKLKPLADLYSEIKKTQKSIVQNQALVSGGQDSELVQMAENEINQLQTKLTQSLSQAKKLLQNLESPKESAGQNEVILEIRGAAGGDEAKLWAEGLERMYSRYAQSQGWKVQCLDDRVIKISGQNAYSQLKLEAGVHRVQRVPVTESQGRIHTSTATVAVLPEIKEAAIKINPDNLELETFRSGGPGGQNVNKVNTAVRIKHIPSNITAVCSGERSQHQNRQLAMEILRAKLWQQAEEEKEQKIKGLRKKAVGKGMRAEKIRTYNFPQNRVTDHRLKKSWHNLEAVLDGQLDEIIKTLSQALPTDSPPKLPLRRSPHQSGKP
jgi:peptide chain release factor 1